MTIETLKSDNTTVKRFFRCGGCGKEVVLDPGEAELLAQATDLKCAECAGTALGDEEESGHRYEVALTVYIDGEPVAGGKAGCRAESFASSVEYLNTELGRRWDTICNAAALVDQAAPEKGDPGDEHDRGTGGPAEAVGGDGG